MSAVDPWGLSLMLENLPGIISIIDQYRSLDDHIDQNNDKLDKCIESMSPYCDSEFEKQLAKFGDRVGIVVGLALGGKLDEIEAFNEIKIMYKDLKKLYKEEKG